MIFTKTKLRLLYFKAKDEDERMKKKKHFAGNIEKKNFYFLKFAEKNLRKNKM